MQDTAGGGGGGGGGGLNELGRAGLSGLARFRSAPATWLDALLDDDESLKLSGPHHHQGGLTQLLTAGTTNTNTTTTTSSVSTGPHAGGPGSLARASSSSSAYLQQAAGGPDPGFFESSGGTQPNAGFHRMNSSPADFMSGNVDGYFSSYGLPNNNNNSYDYGGSSLDVSPSGKRLRDSDSDHRRGEPLSGASSLLDMEMEKLLEDSVPCRVRAKRGCATHPRSIAERVRRTRISDRIRKLQELVPNMDKQTNTADMLEEAVEYVKTLQKQIQELTEQQKKCKCIAKS